MTYYTWLYLLIIIYNSIENISDDTGMIMNKLDIQLYHAILIKLYSVSMVSLVIQWKPLNRTHRE